MLAKAIAGLMGIPFASTELGGSLPLGESQVGSELVFLDVSSFCASDVARLNDLHNVLTSVQRLLLFFTVDARWSSANLAAACRRFSPLHPDALIANMADEAGSLCAVEELAIAANLPIALFGVGTSIPEHMASAHDYLERRSRIPETATAPAA
jgi:flagellar biosynthesis GTPase FlhF